MKRNHFGPPHFTAFMLWNTLAMKTAEMMLASAQVIGHRTGRMALAGPAPSARDRREFALMGQEKVEASAQSVQAMAAHLLSAPSGARTGAGTILGQHRRRFEKCDQTRASRTEAHSRQGHCERETAWNALTGEVVGIRSAIESQWAWRPGVR